MLNALCSFEVGDAQSTMEENGPDFFFLEYTIFFISDKNLISKAVVNKVKDEYNFIEGGTEGIIDFGIGFLKVKEVIIFGGEFG